MSNFLYKYKIDVGRTFAIILFIQMIHEINNSIRAMLGGPGIALNLAIPIMYFLAKGMWNHQNSSRKWCLGLLSLTIATALASAFIIPYSSRFNLIINHTPEVNPPPWKVIIPIALIVLVLSVLIAALLSNKAKAEFLPTPSDHIPPN